MGLFSSDDEQDDPETYFKPVCTDGNRVLGYLTDGDEKRLVWVKDSTFDTIDGDEINNIIE